MVNLVISSLPSELLNQLWCAVEQYARLSDSLNCCEERTLAILQIITSFVMLCFVHFKFVFTMFSKNNKIVELLLYIIEGPQ